MITLDSIGYFGRFGNQMFQFASTLGVGRNLGYDIKFPIKNHSDRRKNILANGHSYDMYFEIPNCFNIDTNLIGEVSYQYQYKERTFGFSDDAFSISDGTSMSGYFQSEKYFKHAEDEIRSNFTFQEDR